MAKPKKDRTKPQPIRAAGGFLQVAPPSTPHSIIESLVSTLEMAMKAKYSKLVWNGAKSSEVEKISLLKSSFKLRVYFSISS